MLPAIDHFIDAAVSDCERRKLHAQRDTEKLQWDLSPGKSRVEKLHEMLRRHKEAQQYATART